MLRDSVSSKVTVTPQSAKKLTQDIAKYVDRNADILMSLDLSARYSFGDADREVVYQFLGVNESYMEQEIKLSKYIYKNNKNQSNPFYCASVLAAHFLLKKNMKQEAILVLTYMSLQMYVSIHKGRFKYTPNKQIMDYTVAHLDQSFRIKSMPSLYAFIQDNTEVAFETYKTRIARADDNDITYVTDALFTRLKGKMVKIAVAFRDNYENGRYLNADTDNYSEEDYHEMDNNSYIIERMAAKIHMQLIDKRYDRRFLKYSITQSDVSLVKLTNLVDDIITDDTDNEVKEFIRAMIEFYLISSGRGYEYIGRGDFITYMKTAYASNTVHQQMGYIKQTLDRWVNENMMAVGRSNYGKTTRMAYKKSLYMFFVFVINANAKMM